MAAKAAYGNTNPNGSQNPNADHSFGGYQWPGGVPGHLLAVVTAPGNVKIVIRAELAGLVGLMFQIADVKYQRQFTRGWTGGYMNRAITGTNSPSNHSRGKAFDVDAQDNPMSTTFQCNIPPDLVHDWESLGFYWGGRYSGKTDPMHFEYCWYPMDIPRYTAKARIILAGAQQPIPVTPPPVPVGVPDFPLPKGYWYGPLDGGTTCISGMWKNDKPAWIEGLKQAQQRLILHRQGTGLPGLPKSGADGKYGRTSGGETYDTVKWFQQSRGGMAVDGLIGAKTWAELWK